ncbi:hypothetical protein ACGFI3_44385 [Nonomuraea wenchangensis]|uniref:hypothetical protein n=1 Tax=Nonomuraea wenchangensis TaxID=568860 RepID=UPI003715898A
MLIDGHGEDLVHSPTGVLTGNHGLETPQRDHSEFVPWPSHSANPDGWMVIFNELMTRIASRFGHIEPHRAASAYARGLPADLDRKS